MSADFDFTVHSPGSPRRGYSPRSRSPSPVSPRLSSPKSIQSPQSAGDDAAKNVSKDYPSPKSSHYESLRLLSLRTVLRPPQSSSSPLPNPPPISSPEQSTSADQLKHSMFGGSSFAHRPTPFAHSSSQPEGHHSFDLGMINPYSNPTTFQPLPSPLSAQPLYVAGSSATFNPPEGPTYCDDSIEQQPPQPPPRQPLTLQKMKRFPRVRFDLSKPNDSNPPSQGMIDRARPFLFKKPPFKAPTADDFLQDFMQHTTIGAGYGFLTPYLPPRCGTRRSIIKRCLDFVTEGSSEEKLRWVVGPAGVGKSVVMHLIAENIPDGVVCAPVFLSVGVRQDATKIIATIAYRLAVKDGSYHQFIRNEIRLDADLPQKALSVQFKKFIVEPFIENRLLDPSRRLLVLIDGLDECDTVASQQEVLRLITNFCITYPTSPVTWIVASRPEPHIASFFDKAEVARAYVKEEIIIDSEEACEDVKGYLRCELIQKKVKLASPTHQPKIDWPSKHQFTKIAEAAGGLFAYASAVVEYVSNPARGNPVTLLRHVTEAFSGGPWRYGVREGDHPLARLDALYVKILSNIPASVMIDASKLLLLCSGISRPFRFLCNLLGLTEDAAYGAMHHLYSVVKVPKPDEADDKPLQFFHKSFAIYLSDFKRSGFTRNMEDDVEQLLAQCSMRIVGDISDDVVDGDDMMYDNISLSWPGDERFATTDEELKRDLYHHAIGAISDTSHRTILSTILSKVPDDLVIHARKLLLLHLYSEWSGGPFCMLCNLLGLTKGVAYGATDHLHPIVKVPSPGNADDEPIKFFHQSFEDHLLCNSKQTGSGISHDIQVEVDELIVQTSMRIIEEASLDYSGLASDEVVVYENIGLLKGGPGVHNNISLSWPGDDHSRMTDPALRLMLYSSAIVTILLGFAAGTETFLNMACFNVLTTRFTVLGTEFPFSQVQDFALDTFRHELVECGRLKQVPIRALDFTAICGPIHLQFSGPKGPKLPDHWKSSCIHEQKGEGEGWSTRFGRYEDDGWSDDDNISSSEGVESDTEIPRFNRTAGDEYHWCVLGEECLWAPKRCDHCLERLARHFIDNPDQLVAIFIDSTQLCYAELSFVDPDGVSHWKYRFFHSGSPTM